MKQETLSLLERLTDCSLFTSVGQPIESESLGVVPTWKAAYRQCKSRDTKRAWVEAMNAISDQLLSQKQLARYRLWNDIASEARQRVKSSLMHQLDLTSERNNFDVVFANCVVGDFVGASLELEYADIARSSFFAELSKWYFAGHWPCAWEGEYPAGRLIVF